MNKIGIYTRSKNDVYDDILTALERRECSIVTDLNDDVDCLLSLGGDGTCLDALRLTIGRNIPVLGINNGRLGFLADVTPDNLNHALDCLFSGKYRINSLDVLSLFNNDKLIDNAINEFAVTKCDNSSMLSIAVKIDGEELTTYWADGLIIATATGSTAYSMSLGGPIIYPSCANLILTPIAPHNLSVRPLIVPNNVTIELKIEGRGDKILASLDGRNHIIDNGCTLTVCRSPQTAQMISLPDASFFRTLREKLLWGADIRTK